jgi:threonine dehydrogenase-like Zn-dependent dehydrogenase
MRAVLKRGAELVCEELPDPVPGEGQTLVRTLACGICGSDLHSLHYGDKSSITPRGLERRDAWVYGHEYCAEVLEHGPGTAGKLKAGTRVVAMPFAKGPGGTEVIGYSARFPGGFAERMVLTERLLVEVPNGLSADLAALTEPMAVGAHGVARSTLDKDCVAMVVGLGPVGAAVLMNLKAQGFGPVIAVDFSPRRRKLAEALGADVVVDPREHNPHDSWAALGVAAGPRDMLELPAIGVGKRAVIFECVGNPGVLQSIVAGAPFGAEIVVLGVCMEADTVQTGQAVVKEVVVRGATYYSPQEFARSLHNLAEGVIDGRLLITDHVGLAGVADAFERLKNPEEQVKIIVEPGRG